MPFTTTLAVMDTPVVKEWEKVATSENPLGTVAGDQLAAVFQSPTVAPLEGAQVALPAKLFSAAKIRLRTIIAIRPNFISTSASELLLKCQR